MKFDINEYKGKYAMHCKTREEAENFCIYMKEYCSNANYQPEWYGVYKERTAYNLGNCDYCRVRWYMEKGYTILEWSDFMNNTFTKADLKDGMVVEYRDGSRRMVLGDKVIGYNYYNDLASYNNTLESKFDETTINKVYKSTSINLNNYFNKENLTLIWERKEVEEMTLAEVCKLLGKEIKIIQ